jgi:signal transduction histidine kinase
LLPWLADLIHPQLLLLQEQSALREDNDEKALHLARAEQDRRRTVREFAALRQDLIEELNEKRRKEEALRQVQQELEDRVRARTAELTAANKTLRTEVQERERAQKLLRQSHEELESRVAERTAQLAAANEELLHAKEVAERANLAKSELLSRASHELRTPLNAVLGFGQLLEISLKDEKQLQRVQHILRAGEHLLELVNVILDIAEMENTRRNMLIEPVSVKELLREDLDSIRDAALQQDLRLSLRESESGPLYALADRKWLQQAILNLLSNAVKFNRPGGSIVLSCEPHDSRVRIGVTDSGYGLDAEEIQKLFVPFERLSAERRGIEGTGLGLVVAKELVEAMHGSLTVESEPGRGSSFFIELPAAPASGMPELAVAGTRLSDNGLSR